MHTECRHEHLDALAVRTVKTTVAFTLAAEGALRVERRAPSILHVVVRADCHSA